MPSVSVIAYVHNYAQYVAETFGTVLAQTYRDFDFFILDDGSTDGTGEAIAPLLADPRVRYEYQTNKGRDRLHETFNRCLEATTGDLIVIVNGDDVLHPEKIQRQLEVFQANPEVEIVFHSGDIIDAEGRAMGGPFTPERFAELTDICRRRTLARYMFQDNLIPNPTVMFRRSILRKIGLQEVGWMHDYQFWLKAAAARCRFHYLPDRLIRYRVHEDSHSTSTRRIATIHETSRMMRREMRSRYTIDELYPEIAHFPDPSAARAAAHLDLGSRFAMAGVPLFDMAVSEIYQALDLQPDFPEALNNLGVCLFLAGQQEDGRRVLQEAAARFGAPGIQANAARAAGTSEGQFSVMEPYPSPLQVRGEPAGIEDEDPVAAGFLTVLPPGSDVAGLRPALARFLATPKDDAWVFLTQDASLIDAFAGLYESVCEEQGVLTGQSADVGLQLMHPGELESLFRAHLLTAHTVIVPRGAQLATQLLSYAQERGCTIVDTSEQDLHERVTIGSERKDANGVGR